MRVLFDIRMDGGWKEMGPVSLKGGDKLEITDDQGTFAMVYFEYDSLLEQIDMRCHRLFRVLAVTFRQVKDVALRHLLRHPQGTSLPGRQE